MFSSIGRARVVTAVVATALALTALGSTPASAAAPITWSTTATVTQTVTVTETATYNGFEGYGTATATKTATATGTATAATNWEVYYYAVMDAHTKAQASANAAADAEARALAKERALADAKAQAKAAQTSSAAPSTQCGATVRKADGTPWTCTFSDEFRGSALDTKKWSPIDTTTSGFTYGDCFQGLSDNLEVAGGSLNLTTEKEPRPVTCSRQDGSTFKGDYTSAAVTSLGTFSQTYGRVEIRAAMPTTSGPGLQSALWMVPDAPAYYGAWPGSGEIDIAEFFSNYPDRLIPTLHYNSTTPFTQRTNNSCLVYRPTDFHTYVLEWTTKKITISVDGTTCLDHAISPAAPLSGSAPFNRPFNINLTQMLGSGSNAMPAGKAVDATLKVDYVRVWS